MMVKVKKNDIFWYGYLIMFLHYADLRNYIYIYIDYDHNGSGGKKKGPLVTWA